MTRPLLEVNNLTTRFRTERGTVTAVDGVSFHVDPGETLAIVGESGSGKSVTALSVLRLIPNPPGRIESGEILFDGVDLVKLDDPGIRAVRGNKIAMIFQEPMSSLNPALTVGLQVAEPINVHRNTPWAKAYEAATELIGRVRIADAASRLNSYPHQYSGGMRQRVMIAMALACAPRLIIADEPTTALDVTVQAQILDLLKEVTRETGSSLILITHDLGVVARYADRVAVMYGGRIVEVAPARELYARPQHPYTSGLMASVPRLDGEVGPGKSRTGLAVLRMLTPTAGRIVFEGQVIAPHRGAELLGVRRRMQMVYQDPYGSLNPRMTIRDIVGEPLAVHGLDGD